MAISTSNQTSFPTMAVSWSIPSMLGGLSDRIKSLASGFFSTAAIGSGSGSSGFGLVGAGYDSGDCGSGSLGSDLGDLGYDSGDFGSGSLGSDLGNLGFNSLAEEVRLASDLGIDVCPSDFANVECIDDLGEIFDYVDDSLRDDSILPEGKRSGSGNEDEAGLGFSKDLKEFKYEKKLNIPFDKKLWKNAEPEDAKYSENHLDNRDECLSYQSTPIKTWREFSSWPKAVEKLVGRIIIKGTTYVVTGGNPLIAEKAKRVAAMNNADEVIGHLALKFGTCKIHKQFKDGSKIIVHNNGTHTKKEYIDKDGKMKKEDVDDHYGCYSLATYDENGAKEEVLVTESGVFTIHTTKDGTRTVKRDV